MDETRQTICYEDNAGGLHVVHYAGDETVWAHAYWPGESYGNCTAAEMAGLDFIAIEQGSDPVAEGWEGNEADLHGDGFVADPIAWGGDAYPAPEPRWPEDGWGNAGIAGREFLEFVFYLFWDKYADLYD